MRREESTAVGYRVWSLGQASHRSGMTGDVLGRGAAAGPFTACGYSQARLGRRFLGEFPTPCGSCRALVNTDDAGVR